MDKQTKSIFLDLVTDFYCSLSRKKDIQTLSTQISQFVLAQSDINEKQIMGKQILQYFLRLYSKYQIKSNNDWDRAFQLSTAQGRALLFIDKFPLKKMQRIAFQRIRQKSLFCQLYNSTIHTQISGIQNTLFDDIQVEEDIKLKTNYFFKWCLYIRHAKNFRSSKVKDVQNIKISQTFNSYGMKFNYFISWKRLCHKKKAQRQKYQKISKQSRKNMLKKHLLLLRQAGQIIAVQEQLTNIVHFKLINLARINTFKALKLNQEKVKKNCKMIKLKGNIYTHKFMQFLSRGVIQLNNKSYQKRRYEFESNYWRRIMNDILQFLKQKKEIKNIKIEQIKKMRAKSKLRYCSQKKQIQKNSQQKQDILINFLKLRNKNITISILHFNAMNHQRQRNKIDNIDREKSFIDWKMIHFKQQKQSLQKIKRIRKANEYSRVSCLLTNWKQQKEKQQKFALYYVQIQNLRRQRMFKTRIINTKMNNERKKIIIEADIQGKKILCKKMMKRWKKINQYNEIQSNALKKINKIGNYYLGAIFLRSIRKMITEKQRFQQVAKVINKILLKISFCKIGGQSFFINCKIKSFHSRQSCRIKSYLFNLLNKNMKYNEFKRSQVELYFIAKAKLKFIKQLSVIKKNNIIKKQCAERIKILNKVESIKHLKKYISQNSEIQIKKNFTASKIFLINFRKSVLKQYQSCINMQQKMAKLAHFLKYCGTYKFIQKTSKKIKDYEKQRTKCYQIVQTRALRTIKMLQSRINKQNSRTKIKLQANKLKQTVMIKSLRLMLQDYWFLKFKKQRQIKKKANFLKQLQNQRQLSRQINLKTQKLEIMLLNKYSRNFIGNIIKEIKEAAYKYNQVEKLIKQKENLKKKSFIKRIKAERQNICQNRELFIFKAHNYLSELLTTFYKRKYGKIKYNYSLKFYATNLLKKSIKSLKKNHNHVHFKQNAIKFDKTSSLMAQRSIQKSFKSQTLSDHIQKFNLRKSRHIR